MDTLCIPVQDDLKASRKMALGGVTNVLSVKLVCSMYIWLSNCPSFNMPRYQFVEPSKRPSSSDSRSASNGNARCFLAAPPAPLTGNWPAALMPDAVTQRKRSERQLSTLLKNSRNLSGLLAWECNCQYEEPITYYLAPLLGKFYHKSPAA
jgi:hypothetical protein